MSCCHVVVLRLTQLGGTFYALRDILSCNMLDEALY